MSFLLEWLKVRIAKELKEKFGYTNVTFPDDSFNLAIAEKDGKMFHIRPQDGAPCYPQRYDWVAPFHGVYAQAKDGRNWFHIDLGGYPAYEQRFDWVGPFSEEERAEAKKDGEKFRIRTDGTRVD